MIKLGQYSKLQVIKKMDFGYFLNAENYGEILLPKKHAPSKLAVGDFIDVFIYLDTEDKPIATTQKPKVCVGEFAYLKALDVNATGAFLDWGLDKDLMVPFSEQHRPMETGRSYLIYVYVDKVDNRITASSKIDKFLKDEKPHQFKAGQAVDVIIANSTDLGYKAIINHSHWGVLYKNEVHQRLSFGQSITAFIKQLRPDGKIDLALSLAAGKETRDKTEQLILSKLKSTQGFLAVHDKSDPEIIADLFGISKGAFKKAVGALYKQKIIVIKDDGIHLL